ncbi:procathepsin L-like [Planococcus citri]|uniref:procathepsin L-like n=1 Tax=Planococcus citri TaxID=170843 RepID=UPI0031F8F437
MDGQEWSPDQNDIIAQEWNPNLNQVIGQEWNYDQNYMDDQEWNHSLNLVTNNQAWDSDFSDGNIDLQEWNFFKSQFNKNYENNEEEQNKIKVYSDNKNKINEHNARFEQGEVSYDLKMNHFGDLTYDEFSQTHLNKLQMGKELDPQRLVSNPDPDPKKADHLVRIHSIPKTCGTAPETKDWVKEGAVTEVKTQGVCGCCWAFASTGAIEAQLFIQTKKLVSLSEQNLLDCVGDRHDVNNTCTSGGLLNSFEYVLQNDGIDTAKAYPYTGVQGACHYDSKTKGGSIKDFKRLAKEDENLLKEVVGLIGPVACGFNIDDAFFVQFYQSGIYSSDKCGGNVNHGVLVVGYGTENGKDYWLCKNQWGTSWGEGGYFKVARNSKNMCGIASECYIPLTKIPMC